MGMMGGDGIPALGGTADRRPAVDPTALPIGSSAAHRDGSPYQLRTGPLSDPKAVGRGVSPSRRE